MLFYAFQLHYLSLSPSLGVARTFCGILKKSNLREHWRSELLGGGLGYLTEKIFIFSGLETPFLMISRDSFSEIKIYSLKMLQKRVFNLFMFLLHIDLPQVDPATIKFQQKGMRKQLHEGLENQELTMFPHVNSDPTSKTKQKRKDIIRLFYLCNHCQSICPQLVPLKITRVSCLKKPKSPWTIGLLSLFTVQWKILFQEVCSERTDWYEQLRDDHSKWNLLICELQTLNSVTILRCYFHDKSSRIKSVEPHCFSNASEKAFAAVIYLGSIYKDGRVDVTLVASDTKVALSKKQCRLDSLGARILATAVDNALPQKLEPMF